MDDAHSYLCEHHGDHCHSDYQLRQRMLRSNLISSPSSESPQTYLSSCAVQPVCSGETACEFGCVCVSCKTLLAAGISIGTLILGIFAVMGLLLLRKFYIKPRRSTVYSKLSIVTNMGNVRQTEVQEGPGEQNLDYRQKRQMKLLYYRRAKAQAKDMW